MAYRIVRSEEYEGKHVDLYLTENGDWGLRREAVEFEGKNAAKEMYDWQKYNSPYNGTGDYTYSIESD